MQQGGAWDWITETAGDAWDWTTETWNNFTDWMAETWNNLPDKFKDFIKIIGVIAGFIAAIAALVALSAISLAVGIGAAILATILLLGYWLIKGGTDDFNIFHAILWGIAGALGGGALVYFVGPATLMAFLRALPGRTVRGIMWLGRQILSGTKWLGGRMLAGTKWLGGKILSGLKMAWAAITWAGGKVWTFTKWLGSLFSRMWATKTGRGLILAEIFTGGVHMLELFNGDGFSFLDLAIDMVITGVTYLIGGAFVSIARSITPMLKKLAFLSLPGIVGSIGNGALQWMTEGSVSLDDFVIGFLVGNVGVALEFTLGRFNKSNNLAIEFVYEGIETGIGEGISWIGEKIEIGKTAWDNGKKTFKFSIDWIKEKIGF